MSESWLRLLSDPEPWRAPSPRPDAIRTSRTVVRLYEQGDGPALFAAVATSRSTILPWMIWALTDHLDVSHSVHYVERFRRLGEQPDCTNFPMGIFDPQTGELIGGTGLHDISTATGRAEIGYWIRGDRHGQGLCTEAVGALISQSLRGADAGGWGLRRIVIYNTDDNEPSRRVCQKLGLRLESRERASRYRGRVGEHPAGYHDTFGFGVLRDEWDFDADRAKPDIHWD